MMFKILVICATNIQYLTKCGGVLGDFFWKKILNGFYNPPNTPFFIKFWGFITLYFPKVVFFLQLWGIINKL